MAQRESERRRTERVCPERQARPTSYLLADVIAEYLRTVKGWKRSYRDDARYGRVWAERFQGRTLEEVGPADIERVKTERLESVKPASVNRELAFLKRIFNVAIRDGKTERNPFIKLKMLGESSGRARYLSDEEEARLLAALSTQEDRDRVTLLIQTGLRKSEFLGLRWKDVDFKACVLTIPRAKNGETRHVPMTSTVRTILSRRPRPLDSSALVFSSGDSQRHAHWAEKVFPKAVRAAGIEDFRLHDLRHTFASRLAMEGVDPTTIKELGGWKSLAMVQRYSHLSPAHRRDAIEKLVTRPTGRAQARATGGGVAP